MKFFSFFPRNRRPRDERGTAVLIILVFLACMAAILAFNASTLHVLKEELKLIDQRQQRKFEPTTPR